MTVPKNSSCSAKNTCTFSNDFRASSLIFVAERRFSLRSIAWSWMLLLETEFLLDKLRSGGEERIETA